MGDKWILERKTKILYFRFFFHSRIVFLRISNESTDQNRDWVEQFSAMGKAKAKNVQPTIRVRQQQM